MKLRPLATQFKENEIIADMHANQCLLFASTISKLEEIFENEYDKIYPDAFDYLPQNVIQDLIAYYQDMQKHPKDAPYRLDEYLPMNTIRITNHGKEIITLLRRLENEFQAFEKTQIAVDRYDANRYPREYDGLFDVNPHEHDLKKIHLEGKICLRYHGRYLYLSFQFQNGIWTVYPFVRWQEYKDAFEREGFKVKKHHVANDPLHAFYELECFY